MFCCKPRDTISTNDNARCWYVEIILISRPATSAPSGCLLRIYDSTCGMANVTIAPGDSSIFALIVRRLTALISYDQLPRLQQQDIKRNRPITDNFGMIGQLTSRLCFFTARRYARAVFKLWQSPPCVSMYIFIDDMFSRIPYRRNSGMWQTHRRKSCHGIVRAYVRHRAVINKNMCSDDGRHVMRPLRQF